MYPEELQILILALQHSIFSKAMFDALPVPVSWISPVGSTAPCNITLNIVTFSLLKEKKIHLSKKKFAQSLSIPNVEPFYKLTNEQILQMFNEMGYQPPLTKISNFKKSGLPSLQNIFFGIYLRCLTVGLDKGRLEVYAMVAGLYYHLHVDYATQLQNVFVKSFGNTNTIDGISCARYWSIILNFSLENEGIDVPKNEETATFLVFHFPKTVEGDVNIFPRLLAFLMQCFEKSIQLIRCW